jgi:hypothetical protein
LIIKAQKRNLLLPKKFIEHLSRDLFQKCTQKNLSQKEQGSWVEILSAKRKSHYKLMIVSLEIYDSLFEDRGKEEKRRIKLEKDCSRRSTRTKNHKNSSFSTKTFARKNMLF